MTHLRADGRYSAVSSRRFSWVNRRKYSNAKAGMPMEDEVTKKLPEMTAQSMSVWAIPISPRQGDLNMAFLRYDKAPRREPSQARVRYKVGLLSLKRDVADESLKGFREILKQDTKYALAYKGTDQALLKMQKCAEAEQYFRYAPALDSALWQCHNSLGKGVTKPKPTTVSE